MSYRDRQIMMEVKIASGGKCTICGGKEEGIHDHHIVTRSCKRLRHDRANHLAVCGKCHNRPMRIWAWLKKTDRKRYNYLMDQRRRWLAGEKLGMTG